MQLTFVPLVAASLLTIVSAQLNVAVKLYQNENAGGRSKQFTVTNNNCIYVGNDFNDITSSLGIFPNGYYCTFYDSGNCQQFNAPGGAAVSFGSGQTNNVGPVINDVISSFRCFKTN